MNYLVTKLGTVIWMTYFNSLNTVIRDHSALK